METTCENDSLVNDIDFISGNNTKFHNAAENDLQADCKNEAENHLQVNSENTDDRQ